MVGRWRTGVVAVSFAFTVAGCASLAPGESASPAPVTSVAPSLSSQSAAPTTGAATTKPTKKPRKTDAVVSEAPSATPEPTQTATASGPNIAITGFVSTTDQVLAGAPSTGRVSLLNNGPLEVGQFFVGITWVGADGLSQGFTSPVSVEGMTPGQSFDVTVDLSLSDPGDVIFTAKADTDDVLKESNEEDNSKTLSITAVSLPNLKFSAAEYKLDALNTIPNGIDQNGQLIYDYIWTFTVGIQNTGSAATATYQIGLYYLDAGGQRIEEPVVPFDTPLQPGGNLSYEFNEPVLQDTTRLYLELDPLDDIVEFDESDNDSSAIPEILPQ